jgi:hypothetical protein
MTNPLSRRTPVAPALQLVERTTHYVVRAGRIYQEVIVRADDGRLYRSQVAA